MIFGVRELWAIEVDPLPSAPLEPDPAAAATWCAIRIWAQGKNLTAHTRKSNSTASDALHWPAAYLARWIVRSWNGLWERAGWPLPGALVDAERACRKLDQHLAELDLLVDDEMLDRRDEFVRSHSLLAAAAGGLMPHVYLLKEGSTVHVTWREASGSDSDVAFHEPSGRASVSADVFLDAMVAFAKWCGKVVAGHDGELADEVVHWVERLDRPEAAEAVLWGYLQPWGAAVSPSNLPAFESRLRLPSDWRTAGARLDPERSSVAVVFRALAPVVEADDVLVLLDRLQSYRSDSAASTKLKDLRSGMFVDPIEPPHRQGYSLAEQLRKALGNPDQRFEVEDFLENLGVQIDSADLSDETVDGATVWGDQHGPVIILNSLSSKQEPWARRMILAHELCHLLVDRQAAGDLMVASTPWAPPEIERRANAFAAELLLPKAGILRVVPDSVRLGWVGEADRVRLMDEFEVGATVCGHQLQNRLHVSG